MLAARLFFSPIYGKLSGKKSHQQKKKSRSAASSPAQAEGDHPSGEEGTVEHGHLLGVVVVVVVDVDGCRDATDDEGDPAGNQVEPAWRGDTTVSPHTRSKPLGEHGTAAGGMGLYGRASPAPASGRGAGEAPAALRSPVGPGRGAGVSVP